MVRGHLYIVDMHRIKMWLCLASRCWYLLCYSCTLYRYPSTATKTNLAAAIVRAFPNLRSDGPLGHVSAFVIFVSSRSVEHLLWPWTFAVYRLWRDETLYQSWTQSSNRWRCYCDLNIWPNDLEHVLCCVQLSDVFHHVWPSTTYPRCELDLLTLNFYSTSRVTCLNFVQNLGEIQQSMAELFLP